MGRVPTVGTSGAADRRFASTPYCEGSTRRTAIPQRPIALVTFALLRVIASVPFPAWVEACERNPFQPTDSRRGTHPEVCKNRSGRLSMRKPSSPLIAAAGCTGHTTSLHLPRLMNCRRNVGRTQRRLSQMAEKPVERTH
jgi:hypothetical protein